MVQLHHLHPISKLIISSIAIHRFLVLKKKKMKAWLAALLLVTLILSSTFLESTATEDSSYCGEKCGVRCSKAGLTKRCLKYCGICCAECKCVPSGTYGNKSECPCYRDKLNSKGNPKCP